MYKAFPFLFLLLSIPVQENRERYIPLSFLYIDRHTSVELLEMEETPILLFANSVSFVFTNLKQKRNVTHYTHSFAPIGEELPFGSRTSHPFAINVA